MARTSIDPSLLALIPASKITGLNILQAPVFASETTGGSTTSSTMVVGGASLSITPTSASSRILLFGVSPINNATSSDGAEAVMGFARNGTALITRNATPAQLVNGGINSSFVGSLSLFYIDSPATTSAITYRLTFASGTGTTVNFGSAAGTGMSTYIMAIEVA